LKWFFGPDELYENKWVDEYKNFILNNYNLTVADVPYETNFLERIKKDAGLVARLSNVAGNADWRIYRAKTSKNRAELLHKQIQAEIDQL
jgi:hypothetical protein